MKRLTPDRRQLSLALLPAAPRAAPVDPLAPVIRVRRAPKPPPMPAALADDIAWLRAAWTGRGWPDVSA